ncbi:hypothetical protein M407DRAFT_27885 [Tulasnella calospora MUT 4182]|uniref:Uncharacterized protein n=1 Tax=Tulasnella calospora MUT 4182 TaxID=1051891 RepID=A0A0C3QD04_9AGAM|nr:hypothetical protein M407DRAFT_27885 [Tulasnella calospora MUT 4182]
MVMLTTASELANFRQYDVKHALHLITNDEGKDFNEILPKPAGYDTWANDDDSLSIANWVLEKKNQVDLTINELER